MAQTSAYIQSMRVWLNDVPVGNLVRTPGEFNAFNFDPAYRATGGLPILSLSFNAATGGLRKDPRPLVGQLPAFFANLLPEERLRQALEKHHFGHVRAGNDFDLLAALGHDLPGAVIVLPTNAGTISEHIALRTSPKARFSLAGVQMKLSVMKDASRGLTLPVGNAQGDFIAKFPSMAFNGVSENEYANLALARAIGMEVPPHELVERSDFVAIPQEFDMLCEGKILLTQRFDRGDRGTRIHIEDFAQVFGIYPAQKYEAAAYHDIARVLGAAVSGAQALEFVRRLALAALTGNGDMHLKNWSLIYREPGARPSLAPLYDVLSTIPYIPSDNMALTLGGTRAFKALTQERWKQFANRAQLPQSAVLNAVVHTLQAVNDHWWTLAERALIPKIVLERIDQHIRDMTPILSTCADK